MRKLVNISDFLQLATCHLVQLRLVYGSNSRQFGSCDINFIHEHSVCLMFFKDLGYEWDPVNTKPVYPIVNVNILPVVHECLYSLETIAPCLKTDL